MPAAQAKAGYAAGHEPSTDTPNQPSVSERTTRAFRDRTGKLRADLQQLKADANTAYDMALTPHRDTQLRNASAAMWQAELLRRSYMAKAFSASPEYVCNPDEAETRVQAAISGTFTAVVSGAVTLIIGIYVFSSISSTMPTPENAELAQATNTTTSTTGQAFTLGAVAIIVMVAAMILGLIGTFGSPGMGGGGRRRR